MTFAELLQQYFERSGALQNYWTLYVVIAGGLLAFSSLRQKPDKITGVLVTVLFCIFAYKNCGAIGEATNQRLAIYQALEAAPKNTAESGIFATLNHTPWDNGMFHYTSDVLIVLTLWGMELRRMRYAKKEPATV
jgi:hypothetical protein